jgi:hypothetical protein
MLSTMYTMESSCFRGRKASHARKYLDPLPVVTTSPGATFPRVIGLVVTRSPSRKLLDPLMAPEMVPSPFCLHLKIVGTPAGAVFGAGFETGTTLATGVGAGFGAGFDAGFGAGLGAVAVDMREKLARGAGAVFGADDGGNKEKLGRGCVTGFGVGAAFVAGVAFATGLGVTLTVSSYSLRSLLSPNIPNNEKVARGVASRSTAFTAALAATCLLSWVLRLIVDPGLAICTVFKAAWP